MKRVLVALVCLLGVFIDDAEGSRGDNDVREVVQIKIVHDEGSKALALKLAEDLIAARFDASLVEKPDEAFDARAFLKENGAEHAVIGLSENVAKVYTRGVATPAVLQASSAENVIARIRAYLTSREVVSMRIEGELPDPDSIADPDEKFRALINRGLQIMLEPDPTPEGIQRAIDYYLAAGQLKPEEPIVPFNLALAYGRLGDQASRKVYVQKGLALDSQNSDLRNEEAVLLMMQGRYEDAIKKLRLIPEKDPTVSWNIAYAYSQLGREDEAKKELATVVELDSSELRMRAEDLQSIIAQKELQIESQSRWLASLRRSLWLAMVGLLVVGLIGAIALFLRRAAKRLDSDKALKPADRFAFRLQVTVTVVSGAFSILNLTLSSLLG